MSEKKLVRKETGRSKKTRGSYGLKAFGKEKKMHYVIGDIHNELMANPIYLPMQ